MNKKKVSQNVSVDKVVKIACIYKEFMTVLCVRGGVLWYSRFACYTSHENSEILFRAFKPILRVSWEQKCTECHSLSTFERFTQLSHCCVIVIITMMMMMKKKRFWHDTYDLRINEGDVTVKKISRSDLAQNGHY